MTPAGDFQGYMAIARDIDMNLVKGSVAAAAEPGPIAIPMAMEKVLLEHGGDPRMGQGPRWLQVHFDGDPHLPALKPPEDRGAVTVADVHGATSPQEHAARVYRWARAVWEAWREHHDWARQWLRERWQNS